VTETSIFKTHDYIKKVLPKKLCFTLCTRVRGVTVRIVVKAHPNKKETINVITMYTNQILSDKSNP
jgi:hypothetical protein